MSIRTGTVNGVATIEIARPDKKNALTIAMYEAMAAALDAAREDAAIRAVLITGQPGVFTSGNDIEDFMARPPGQGSDALDSPVARFMRSAGRSPSRLRTAGSAHSHSAGIERWLRAKAQNVPRRFG